MKLLADLNKNARVSLAMLPVWSVFWGLVFFYSPLYMRSLGLDEVDIGVVGSVSLACAFLCNLVASPIANRLGRRRATVIFDTLSWSVPMILWAVSRNIWFFLAAGVINATSKVTVISWNCLVSEDEKPENVSRIFTIITLINSAIGVFAPITGFFIVKFGLVPSMRVLYALGGVSMAAMFIARNFFVQETRAGAKLMADHAGKSLARSVGDYLKMAIGLRHNRNFLTLSLIFIATNFVTALNVFQVIYLTERLGYSQRAISLIPFIVAVANIALFALAVPRFAKRKSESVLVAFALANLASSVLFMLIPAKSPVLMLAVMAVNGMSNFILLSYRESVFMNAQEAHEKGDMYSAVQTLMLLCSIPAGYVGGLLYRANALLPFVLASALYAVCAACAVVFAKRNR